MDIGSDTPDVAFTMADGRTARISEWRGKPLVLYFYPKDDTPGCTTEAKTFSALMPEFDSLGVTVIGVSRDSVTTHAKFSAKHDLRVSLASDTDGGLTEAFGVWVKKSMYGKTYLGIERATFIIDRDGRAVAVWRKVKVAGHAESVLAAARAL